MPKPQYICPICHQDLDQQAKTFVCENQHCFDIAKENYVHLLPVQQKKSKNPGDNKIMMQSRKDFLGQHFYDELILPCAEIIDALILERFPHQCCLLDMGCGEGYFTRQIYRRLTQTASCYGMDISKDAVRFSAKSDKSIAWSVASYNNIPLKNNSVDILLKINAPLNYQKCFDKLSDKGVVISITPGKFHLDGLKSIIYEEAQMHEVELCPDKYTHLTSKQLVQKMQLDNTTDIKNLFMMTPFFWNASQTSKNKIDNLHHLNTNVAFDINVWEKT